MTAKTRFLALLGLTVAGGGEEITFCVVVTRVHRRVPTYPPKSLCINYIPASFVAIRSRDACSFT
jgi:hypothetical protein